MALAVVTGATGMVGTELVRHLRQLRWRVIALVRKGSDASGIEALGAGICRVDLLDRSAVTAAVPEGADVLFHLAAAPFNAGFAPDYISRVNEDGLRSILFAAVDKRVTCTVYLSDSVVYGFGTTVITEEKRMAEPEQLRNSYARSRRECEAILGRAMARGLDAISVLPAGVIGAGLRIYRAAPFREMLWADTLVVPDGGRCFVAIEDVPPALVAAAERGVAGQRYLLGGPYLSWRALLGQFAAVNSLPVRLRLASRLSEPLGRGLARLGLRRTGSFGMDHADAWLMSREQRISSDLAASDLGFAPSGLDGSLTGLGDSLRNRIG